MPFSAKALTSRSVTSCADAPAARFIANTSIAAFRHPERVMDLSPLVCSLVAAEHTGCTTPGQSRLTRASTRGIGRTDIGCYACPRRFLQASNGGTASMSIGTNDPVRTAATSAPPAPRKPIPWGLYIAAIALLAVLALPLPEGLPVAGHRMLAILVFAVIVWISEAVSYE